MADCWIDNVAVWLDAFLQIAACDHGARVTIALQNALYLRVDPVFPAEHLLADHG